ncbi:MAG TPA: DUF3761 domain-containing protein [Gemmatimonadaceae bacterium]|nr:DUF3761 domain-containing protein [Gemmatimonadaceae bacterium]
MIRNLSARSLILASVIALVPFALQAQATTCKDGTTSTATGKGACSGHGGVAKSAAKAAKSDSKASSKVAKTDAKADAKAAKTESKAANKAAKPTTTASATDPNGATAKCKDGTYSHAASRRGACSRHGGVAEWLKT